MAHSKSFLLLLTRADLSPQTQEILKDGRLPVLLAVG